MKTVFCRDGKCIEVDQRDVEDSIGSIGRYDVRDMKRGCDSIKDPVKQIECELLREMAR